MCTTDSPAVPTHPNYFLQFALLSHYIQLSYSSNVCNENSESGSVRRRRATMRPAGSQWATMVANIGVINPSNGKHLCHKVVFEVWAEAQCLWCATVEATAYISAVAAFAVVVLVVLLFLGRRWCHAAVFSRKCCDDILAVNPRAPAPGLPLDNAQFGKYETFVLLLCY